MATGIRRELLAAGVRAPEVRLRALDGSEQNLAEMLRSAPVLLAFFKVSCPTCQFTFPFLDRLSRGGVRFVGVSQDDARYTRSFLERFQVTFPVWFDEESTGYPVSNAYGITHVPSMFLVEPDGVIAKSWTGFSRKDMEELGRRVALVPFLAGEPVPAWKAG